MEEVKEVERKRERGEGKRGRESERETKTDKIIIEAGKRAVKYEKKTRMIVKNKIILKC